MYIDWQPLFERNPSQVLFGKTIKPDEKTMVSESPSLPDLGRHTFLRRPDCYASVWRCKRWIRAHRGSGSGNQFQRGPKMSKVNPKCQKLWLDWLVTVSHLSPCQFGFGMSCGMKFVTVSLWEFFSSSHFWQKGSERNLWMPSQFPVLHCADLQRFSQDGCSCVVGETLECSSIWSASDDAKINPFLRFQTVFFYEPLRPNYRLDEAPVKSLCESIYNSYVRPARYTWLGIWYCDLFPHQSL